MLSPIRWLFDLLRPKVISFLNCFKKYMSSLVRTFFSLLHLFFIQLPILLLAGVYHFVYGVLIVPDTKGNGPFPGYTLLGRLGKGGFGEVRLAQDNKTDALVAVKIITMPKDERQCMIEMGDVIYELSCLKNLKDSTFIPNYICKYNDSDNMYFAQEYVPGGNLRQLQVNSARGTMFPEVSTKLFIRPGQFKEHVVRFYISELVCVLAYLHSHSMVHVDVKPDNIMIDTEGHIKLVDFGLAVKRIYYPAKGATNRGNSPHYAAPELFMGNRKFGYAADWWALGIMMYEMINGYPPWVGNKTEIRNQIKAGGKVPRLDSKSEPARDLIYELLNDNPANRLGSYGSHEIKEHEYFKDTKWDEVENKSGGDVPFEPRLAHEVKPELLEEMPVANPIIW
jgi:serine/threonine protein kinase